MPFPKITKNQIREKLVELGIERGDLLYIASFSAILGNSIDVLEDCIDCFEEAVGPEGTLVMPAFNWDYCKGATFDPLETPSMVGLLTELFRKRPDVKRTLTPPWATFLSFGKDSSKISGMSSRSAFGKDSVLQYLFEMNAKYVLLGCSFNDGAVQIHWLEEKFLVPYRYWKEIQGKILFNGKLVENTSAMYARNLEIDATIDPSRMTNEFEKTNAVRQTRIGLGRVKVFRTQDYVNFMSPFLERDSLALLSPDARQRYEAASSLRGAMKG